MRASHLGSIGLAIASAGYFACTSDASLKVSVEHDPSIAALVDHTVVSIYAQPDLACSQIEFGDISEDQLLGALAAEATGDQPLSGIPRVDPKLVVARGYTADDILVDAGCTPEGEITGDAKVTVTTVPTATVSVTLAADDTSPGSGTTGPGGNGILVTATDVTNASLDKRAVAWRMYGAAGTSADAAKYTNVSDGVWEGKQPTCTANGDARIHPMPPLLPGGFGLGVRVSWATAPPPLFTAFTNFDVGQQVVSSIAHVTTTPEIQIPCALEKHGTTRRLACFDSAASVTAYGFSAQTHGVTRGTPQPLPMLDATDSGWIGVISVDETNGDQNVYAISNHGQWAAVDGAPDPTNGAGWCGPIPGCPFKTLAVKYVPTCGDEPAFLFGEASGLGGAAGGGVLFEQMPIHGGTATTYAPTARTELKSAVVTGAGCVTELQLDGSSKLRQTLVFDSTPASGPETNAVFTCSATTSPCLVALPTSNQAVAFAKGAEPALIGGLFDATGTQLAHWVMKPAEAHGNVAGAKDRLVERSRQVSAAPARQLVTGKLDGDADDDLFWTFLARDTLGVQVAYAREVAGAPLSAVTAFALDSDPAYTNPTPVQLFTADFNGDGFDEIVLVYQAIDSTNLQTVTLFDAVLMGIAYSNPPSPPDDAACN